MFIALNGSSIIFLIFKFITPFSIPASKRALSVGLPLKTHSSFGESIFSTKASEVRAAILRAKNSDSRFSSPFKILMGVITLSTFIFPSVKVPVLSVHITEVLPNVSADDNFLIRPPFFRTLCIPIAKITVIATGSPSGMAATATATAVINISSGFPPVITPSIKIPTDIMAIIIPIVIENFASFFW